MSVSEDGNSVKVGRGSELEAGWTSTYPLALGIWPWGLSLFLGIFWIPGPLAEDWLVAVDLVRCGLNAQF